MSDFLVQCEKLLASEDLDVNTKGWRQVFQVFSLCVRAISETNHEIELRITGSNVEGGKVFMADDVGDSDIIAARKNPEDILSLSRLEDIPNHPGFVKVKDGTGYMKTTEFKESMPQFLTNIFRAIMRMFPAEDGVLQIDESAGSPAIAINFLSQMPAVSSQWENMDLTNGDVVKGMLRVLFKHQSEDIREERIQEMFDFFNKQAGSRGDASNMTQFYKDMLLNFALKLQEYENQDNSTIEEENKPEQTSQQDQQQSQQDQTPSQQDQQLSQQDQKSSQRDQQDQQPTQPDQKLSEQHQQPSQQDQKLLEQRQQLSQQDQQPLDQDQQPSQQDQQPLQQDQHPLQKDQQPSQQDQLPLQQDQTASAVKLTYKKTASQRLESYTLNRMTSKLFVPDQEINDTTTPIRKIGIDLVMGMKLSGWPDLAKECCERQDRIFPTKEVLEKMQKSSIYIVVKEAVNMNEEDMEYCFRFSFSHPEQILFQEMGEVPRLCFRIMKAIHQSIFKKLCDGDNPFKSYHIKTLLFWLLEVNEADTWKMEGLEDCISLILVSLMNALEDKRLNHYFIPDINLFGNFIPSQLDEMLECVISILGDIPGTLHKIEEDFKGKSQIVSMQTEGKVVNSISPQVGVDLEKFHKSWSVAYDEITASFIDEVLSPDLENLFHQYPSQLVSLFRQSKMGKDGMCQVFTTFKTAAYQRHMFNLRDATRDIGEVIIGDIEAASKILKWVLEKPEEDLNVMADDNEQLGEMFMREIEQNQGTAVEAMDSLMPDANEMLDTIMKF